jgi:hypothetical protein
MSDINLDTLINLVKLAKEKDITLVAVSKTKPIELIQQAYDAGIRDFGENKVQEIKAKAEQLPKDINWHLDWTFANQQGKIYCAVCTSYPVGGQFEFGL